MENRHSEKLLQKIEPLRQEIINHPLYGEIRRLEDVAQFMSFHVFAVWDFMSLLKALQRELTCVTIPWRPHGDAETRFLINEIVTGEESDVDQNGLRTSHFELYLQAMNQIGATTGAIESLLISLENSTEIRHTIALTDIPPEAKEFLDYTFKLIEENKPHILAAVFTYGREDLIPEMFLALVNDLETKFPEKMSVLKYYLHRHIEVDGDEHSHLARLMTEKLCGDDAEKWHEAETSVINALQKRIELWNGVWRSIGGIKKSAAALK